jgi:Fic family protein
MFRPNFIYTQNIVNDLLKIYSIRNFIINAHLLVEMEVSLKRETLLKSAHYSTAIEGNMLTLNDVDQLLRGLKINAPEKAQQEVINYLNVLKKLDMYSDDEKISEESILKLHNDLIKTFESNGTCDNYRTVPVFVANNLGEVIYTPPSAYLVEREMEKFIEWINNLGDLNTVIAAGIIHYELMRIQPFVEGNGLTARALTALFLHLEEFTIDRFFTLNEYYESDLTEYYKALNSVDKKTRDLTMWLEYFLEGFLISISRVKDQILLFSPEVSPQEQIKLSKKQIRIIEYIHLNGQISNLEVKKLFNISRQGAYKDLRRLMDLNLIEKKGGSRSTYYVLKNNF